MKLQTLYAFWLSQLSALITVNLLSASDLFESSLDLDGHLVLVWVQSLALTKLNEKRLLKRPRHYTPLTVLKFWANHSH